MAAAGHLLLLACVACLGRVLAAPVRIVGDCVSSTLLGQVPNVYPSIHQIQRPAIQERTTVTVAQNFEITYGTTYKIVSFTKGSTNETYVLYQCGTATPNVAQLGLPTSTKLFSVPLRAVSAPDTTVLNFMKLLGVQDRVSYVTDYAVDPCMQLLTTESCGSRLDYNVPEGAVDGRFYYRKNATDPVSIIFTASADLGPLHGAEYIKYVAAFFNREAVANRVFAGVYQRYYDLHAAVTAWKKANSDVPSPVVAWLYYENWGVEHIQIKFHSYRVQFTMDSGAAFPDLAQLNATFSDGVNVRLNEVGDLVLYNLSTDVTKAALRGILADVDIVIDESYAAGDVTKYTLASFQKRYRLDGATAASEFKFLRTPGALLRLDGTASGKGTTAWFEEALARPDVVLHDLVSFILPGVLQAGNDTTRPRLVRSLIPTAATAELNATNGVTLLTAANCPLQQCGATPQPICPAVFLDCTGKLVTATEAQPCAPTNCLSQNGGSGGAAGRAAVAPVLLLTLLAMALAAVGVAGSWSRQ